MGSGGLSRPGDSGRLHARFVSPVQELLERPLRFEPPLIEISPSSDAFRFWWGQLEAIFDFNDPRDFPAFPATPELPADERAVLDRFVAKSRELAASASLNADAEMRVEISDDNQTETIHVDLPAPDLVAGFAALFRQFYALDERASFRAASGILMKWARAAADEHADKRQEELKRWGRAAGKLRMFSVERLGHEKLIDEGKLEPIEEVKAGTYPDPENPQQVISTFFYGEHLHWGEDKAAILIERKQDAFEDARSKLFFLQAATGLSHLYIGYSVLVQAALARQR